MFWDKFFSLKWRWLLPILIANLLFSKYQTGILYECSRGGCIPWYISYWSIFPLIFLIGYSLVKVVMNLGEKSKQVVTPVIGSISTPKKNNSMDGHEALKGFIINLAISFAIIALAFIQFFAIAKFFQSSTFYLSIYIGIACLIGAVLIPFVLYLKWRTVAPTYAKGILIALIITFVIVVLLIWFILSIFALSGFGQW